MTGPAAVEIVLSEQERSELEARVRRRKIARADALRAEIVLLAADGLNNCAIADEIGVSRMTVLTWRKRFAAKRVDGLDDEPRCGAPQDRGRQDRRCGNEDARNDAFSRDALEHALNGEGVWPVSFDGASHLERILSAASS